MPITEEYRIFWLDGEPLLQSPYWPEGAYDPSTEPPPIASLTEPAQRIQSRFFTMDVARRDTGAWMIVEVGDAQVSGLPHDADATPFYARLRDRLGTARPG
jgi:hypothetical protein